MKTNDRSTALTSPVTDIASTVVIKVDRGASVRDVAARLADSDIGFVVVDEGGSVAGVVSERDVVMAVSEGAALDEVRAEDIMITDLLTVHEFEDVARAGQVMLDTAVRHLLVSGSNGGVVSIRDVLAAALN